MKSFAPRSHPASSSSTSTASSQATGMGNSDLLSLLRSGVGTGDTSRFGNSFNTANLDSADVGSDSADVASDSADVATEAPATEAAAPLLTGNPMLRRGDTGEQVRILQTLLNELSGAGLTVDGDFGRSTHRAVRAFQAANRLSPDGIVGPGTAAKLCAGCTTAPTATTGGATVGEQGAETEGGSTEAVGTVSGSPMLRRGMRGAAVETLQRALNAKGARLTVDGDYGLLTVNAVRAFQQANGLEVDGRVGRNTASALNSADSQSAGAGSFQGADQYADMRDAVLAAAASHLGTPYYWGADGPSTFDCSGFVLYVLRTDMGLINWGDDTAHGIANRVPATNEPQKGDLVFYRSSSGRITHIEFYAGSGSQTLGASGGGSQTRGDNPNAKVQYGNYANDRRSKSFGSIAGLIERKKAAASNS